MKLTKLFGLFVFSAILGLSFASCSDDDDDYVIDNSKVVGTWDFVEVTPDVKFSAEFLQGKSEAEVAVITTKVKARIVELANEDYLTTGSQFNLKTDYSYEFKYLTGEATKTLTGVYSFANSEKSLVFTTPTETNHKFVKEYDLDGTSLTYTKEVEANDIITVGGVKTEDIKSAVVKVEYIKKAK